MRFFFSAICFLSLVMVCSATSVYAAPALPGPKNIQRSLMKLPDLKILGIGKAQGAGETCKGNANRVKVYGRNDGEGNIKKSLLGFISDNSA